ncbi:Hypothetical predicted protein [Prunus dulcis]|uniref:Uncharacterized protein n=1 Tax=Prunus dulcis TaxID=3755 RepID=A0A5E4G2V9_PRUDU|nr:Hypothetical predicted protein [Prunus dulcis]
MGGEGGVSSVCCARWRTRRLRPCLCQWLPLSVENSTVEVGDDDGCCWGLEKWPPRSKEKRNTERKREAGNEVSNDVGKGLSRRRAKRGAAVVVGAGSRDGGAGYYWPIG